MDDLYEWTRIFYFCWAFILFIIMIYWGIQDILLNKRCGHVQVPPEHMLWATAVLGSVFTFSYSLGEILFLANIPGGIRVFLPALCLLPASIALKQGAFRIQMHRYSVDRNLCQQSPNHKGE